MDGFPVSNYTFAYIYHKDINRFMAFFSGIGENGRANGVFVASFYCISLIAFIYIETLNIVSVLIMATLTCFGYLV